MKLGPFESYEQFLVKQARVADIIRGKLPYPEKNYRSISWFHENIHSFFDLICELERLFFADNIKIPETINRTRNGHSDFQFEDRIYNEIEKYEMGFVYSRSPGTRFIESPGRTHLRAAEETFKLTPTHVLKIYTVNNVLFIYSNKDLPFETIVKLKMIQWNMFKDKFQTPQPDIINLLTAIHDKNIDKINEALKNIADLELFDIIRYEELTEVFKTDNQTKITELETLIERKEMDCRRYENALSELMVQLNDLQERLAFYNYKKDEENIEEIKQFLKYLLNHPYIKEVTKINRKVIHLYFEAPIVYFDDFIIKRIRPNYMNNQKAILDAFLDNKYELMVRCRIEFNTSTFKIENAGTNRDMPYIGHPHIDRYSCFGNHRIPLHEAAASGDFYVAIEQISQAVQNLNFADSTVVNEMMHTLRNNRSKPTWRNKETGEIITTEELVKEYRNEEA